MPKKLQLKIQDLEAVKVHYSRSRSQVESLLILLLAVGYFRNGRSSRWSTSGCGWSCSCSPPPPFHSPAARLVMAGLLAWPWFSILEPLSSTMEAVKHAYCGGNQDFVVALNEDMQLTVGFPTVPFEDSAGETVSQIAVQEYLYKDASEKPKYITLQADIRQFQEARTVLMRAAAEEVDDWCLNFDQFFSPDALPPGFTAYYAPHWYSAAVGWGLPENSSCEDLAHLCQQESAQLVRFVCGQTCCSSSSRHSGWYQVPAKGCARGCLLDWDTYPVAIENETGQSLFNNSVGLQIAEMVETMKAQGCRALNSSRWEREIVLNMKWCEGYDKMFAPLARVCPESCGCANLDDPSQAPAGCPEFCNPKCEDLTFLPIGEVATCSDGQALGWCWDPGFTRLCFKTCTGC